MEAAILIADMPIIKTFLSNASLAVFAFLIVYWRVIIVSKLG